MNPWTRRAYQLALSGTLCAGLAQRAVAAMPFAAAESGKTAIIQTALDAGGDINEPNPKGDTLLILACRLGQLETVKFLLGRGAAINRANELGNTPVHVAVSAQNIDVVRHLIDQGADLEIPQKAKIYPIHSAASGVSLELLQLLIDAGADLDVKDENEETPLNFAVYEGRLGHVKTLLAAGASLRLNNTRNPVIRAHGRDHPEILAYLIEQLKNPTPAAATRPAPRREALDAAIIEGDAATVKELIQEPRYQTYQRLSAAIALADRHGRYDISQILTKANASQAELQARRQQLSEQLMEAIRDNKYKEADGLLYAGADPHYVNKDGQLVFTRAVESPPMVKLFLKYQGDPLFTSPTMKVRAPLYEAATENALESVELMLAGARPSQRQLDQTLYFATFRLKSAPLVRLLLNRGANPNAGFTDNNTALHIAAVDSDAETVKALISGGAKVSVKNAHGRTPADFAAANNRSDVLAVLKAAGAATPVVKQGNPLFAAVPWGNLEYIKKLVAEGHKLSDVQNTQFADGQSDRSLLWYAVNYGREPEVVRYLIEQKAKGEPWLLVDLVVRPDAFGPHQPALAQLLMENGYDVNTPNPAGQTPLMGAAMMNNLRDAAILIKKGAKLDARDNNNKTAMDYAFQGGHGGMVKLLEKAGAKQ